MDSKQKVLFSAALSSDPPLLTSDPFVNYKVDQHMDDDAHIPYDSALYIAEIAVARERGSWILTLEGN